MSTVLYVILGAVLGIILTPLVLWIAFKLFVRFFLKKLADALGGGGGVPPMRLEAVPIEGERDWNNPKRIEQLTDQLEKHGFQQAGDQTLLSSPTVDTRGFANPDRSLYAVIYDWPDDMTPGLTTSIDVVASGTGEGEERQEYTVSNSPKTWLDHPPWSNKENLDLDIDNPGIAVSALLKRMDELVEGIDLVPTPTSGFLDAFKAAYAREMDWQIERGGLQREELMRNLVNMQGMSEDDERLDEVIELTQSQWNYAISNFVGEETRQRFLRHVTKMSAGEWEDIRDRVFVVHERSMTDQLKEELVDRLLDREEIDTEEDDEAYDKRRDELLEQLQEGFAEATPREGFAAAQEHLPAAMKYKRLARIKSPWPADVYLEPEWDAE